MSDFDKYQKQNQTMTPSEDKILPFLEAVINDTINDKLDWEVYQDRQYTAGRHGGPIHRFMRVGEFSNLDPDFPIVYTKEVFKSYYYKDGGDLVNEVMYEVQLKDNTILCVVQLQDANKTLQRVDRLYEVWMKIGETEQFLCGSNNHPDIAVAVANLYDYAAASAERPKIRKEVESLISSYLGETAPAFVADDDFPIDDDAEVDALIEEDFPDEPPFEEPIQDEDDSPLDSHSSFDSDSPLEKGGVLFMGDPDDLYDDEFPIDEEASFGEEDGDELMERHIETLSTFYRGATCAEAEIFHHMYYTGKLSVAEIARLCNKQESEVEWMVTTPIELFWNSKQKGEMKQPAAETKRLATELEEHLRCMRNIVESARLLYFEEGRSLEDIAEALVIPVEGIRWILSTPVELFNNWERIFR